MPVTVARPRSSSLRGGLDHVRPVGQGGAAPGESGVDLELQPGRAVGLLGGLADLGQLGDGVRRDVDVGDDRVEVALARHPEPAQHPAVVAGARSASASSMVATPEPVGAGLAGGPRRGHDPVAVAVGLDHRHHLRRARPARAAAARCAGSRPGRPRSPRARSLGSWAPILPLRGDGSADPRHQSDRRGDRAAPRRRPRAGRRRSARVAAAPCSQEPTEAASYGVSPAASSDPIRPASTSPAPAVASHGTPVVVTRTRPSGRRPACGAP